MRYRRVAEEPSSAERCGLVVGAGGDSAEGAAGGNPDPDHVQASALEAFSGRGGQPRHAGCVEDLNLSGVRVGT